MSVRKRRTITRMVIEAVLTIRMPAAAGLLFSKSGCGDKWNSDQCEVPMHQMKTLMHNSGTWKFAGAGRSGKINVSCIHRTSARGTGPGSRHGGGFRRELLLHRPDQAWRACPRFQTRSYPL